jgi:hypothetical protein
MTRPAILLRLEAAGFAVVFALTLWVGEADWRWVVAGLVLPDLSLLGYRWGPVIGARVYNSAHSYVLPGALMVLVAALARLEPPYLHATPLGYLAVAIALHIAVDRVLGYGLKLPSGFRDTHLGRIGHG